MNIAKSSVREAGAAVTSPKWGFLTNHAVVLIHVILHPDSTVRMIASGIGITERAALAILRGLDDDGIVDRHRDGRRNTYSVNFDRLSSVRRGGATSPLTPRPFVEVIVRMLFVMASESGNLPRAPREPRQVLESELEPRIGTWGFFTNHLLVLLAIARDRSATVRELAAGVGITERAVLGILGQLEADGIIERKREGRRTTYAIDFEAFRSFRGWTFSDWSIPASLINVATDSIQSLATHTA